MTPRRSPVPKTSLRARLRHGLTAATVAVTLALGVTTPQTSAAWDPSTTHLGMVDRAVLESALHLRWMASTELQRGLFSPLRVDPARLSASERRFLGAALTHGHSGAGVLPLGGPGACPGSKAPPATQLFCVEGDVWEMPAVHWLHLGVVAELIPSARAVHHFVDRKDPSSREFNDPQQRPLVLRSRQFRHNGAPLAGYITGSSFAGTGPSAIEWLSDRQPGTDGTDVDPLAPPATFRHLELASTHPEPRARDHHLAMALIGLGALLHVLQDMAVPAHARGDVTAFFSALSSVPGDRGLPFAELARLSFGRHALPGRRPAESISEARGVGLAHGLHGHFLGDAGYEGLAVFTGRRFLSEHSVPAPMFIEPDLDAQKAAARLLADADLDPTEIKGAVLSPWPAERGYVKTVTGRPLAAFDTDDLGQTRTFIDEAVYREQFAQLVPRAVEASRSLIDWIWPSWPELHYDAAAGTLDFEVSSDLTGFSVTTNTGGSASTTQEFGPELLVFTQTAEGLRTIKQKVRLKPGIRNRVQNLPKLQQDERIVVVLRSKRASGETLILEQVLGAESKTFGVVPPPYVAPPPPLPPAPIEAPATPEPDTSATSLDPEPGDPTATDPAGTPATDATTKPPAAKPTGTASKPATDPARPATEAATKPAAGASSRPSASAPAQPAAPVSGSGKSTAPAK